MKLIDAINEVNNLKPNFYELPEKIKWLSRVEQMIYDNIICTHEYNDGEEEIVFDGYEESDQDKTLIVHEPYDELYVHWLSAQIDWNNREFVGFNNSNAMFESVYSAFRDAYNRSHMPKSRKKIYF